MLWRTFAEPMTSRLARSQSVVDPPVADRAEPPICTLVVNGSQVGEHLPKDRYGAWCARGGVPVAWTGWCAVALLAVGGCRITRAGGWQFVHGGFGWRWRLRGRRDGGEQWG